MKLNFPMTFVSLVVAGLIFYGFLKNNSIENYVYPTVIAIVSFLTLLCATSISMPKSPRSGVMLKTVSGVFFVLTLITNICFAAFDVSNTTLIIVNAAALCLWFIIAYGVAKARQ